MTIRTISVVILLFVATSLFGQVKHRDTKTLFSGFKTGFSDTTLYNATANQITYMQSTNAAANTMESTRLTLTGRWLAGTMYVTLRVDSLKGTTNCTLSLGQWRGYGYNGQANGIEWNTIKSVGVTDLTDSTYSGAFNVSDSTWFEPSLDYYIRYVETGNQKNMIGVNVFYVDSQ